MRGIKYTFVGAAMVAGLSFAGGCGDKGGMGGMGGNILGDFAARQATGMMTGGAQKQQQQAEQQAAAQQAAATSGGYGTQQPATEYKAPAMDMTGTLVEKKNAAGQSMGWTFMQEGSAVGMAVDVSKVEADARTLAGKKVILTGRYDTQAGEAKLVAESLSVAAQ